MYVFSYFTFGLRGGVLDLIVSVPEHRLSFSSLQNHDIHHSNTILDIRHNHWSMKK